MNSRKIILDLCGGTGSWSAPYKENGYDVRVITLPEYDLLERTTIEGGRLSLQNETARRSGSRLERFTGYSPRRRVPCSHLRGRRRKPLATSRELWSLSRNASVLFGRAENKTTRASDFGLLKILSGSCGNSSESRRTHSRPNNSERFTQRKPTYGATLTYRGERRTNRRRTKSSALSETTGYCRNSRRATKCPRGGADKPPAAP